MSELIERYDPPWAFTHGSISHLIYSGGKGPPVLVLHELPGMMPECIDLGLILAQRFRVHLPLLFGKPGEFAVVKNIARLCVSREIHAFAANKTSPLVGWIRALCRRAKEQAGSDGVGVVGMCLTGGFALATIADDTVLGAVVAQPTLPLLVRRSALGISPEDQAVVRKRAAVLGPGCVLGLRYANDTIAPRVKVDTIRNLIGDAFRSLEYPGSDHATLTKHRQPEALRETIAFLSERLTMSTAPTSS
jgi:dienelactone hydrolase